MSLLYNGQFGVEILHGQVLIRWLLGAVHHESPFLDESRLRRWARMANFQSPLAIGILAPGVSGHEGPFYETIVVIVVIGSSAENHGPAKRVDVRPVSVSVSDDGA